MTYGDEQGCASRSRRCCVTCSTKGIGLGADTQRERSRNTADPVLVVAVVTTVTVGEESRPARVCDTCRPLHRELNGVLQEQLQYSSDKARHPVFLA